MSGSQDTIAILANKDPENMRNCPMTTITIRMPEDVIENLKRVASLLGFSGYQTLGRAYIGQGLRFSISL